MLTICNAISLAMVLSLLQRHKGLVTGYNNYVAMQCPASWICWQLPCTQLGILGEAAFSFWLLWLFHLLPHMCRDRSVHLVYSRFFVL